MIAQAAQFGLTLGYNMVLARLLTPEEFGLVAIGMSIVGVLYIFRDMGLSTSTIQRAEISHAQVSNLFWINTGGGCAISLLLVLGAPFSGWFFKDPRVSNVTLSLAALFLLNGLSAQHTALLNRQMRFIAISVIEVVSMAVAFSTGAVLAKFQYGYWSLIIATLIQATLRLILTWYASDWWPQLPKKSVGTRSLVTFGTDLTIGGFIYSLARGSDTLILGRVFGSDAVGLYSRAAALLSRPMEQLVNPVFTVMVPALSRLQDQPERYRRTFLVVFETMAIGGYLFTGVALPLSQALTIVLLGLKWQAAGPIFAALSAAAVFIPLSSAASWLYTSQGRGREGMFVAITSGCLVVLAVFIGLPFGALGVAVALSCIGVLGQLPLSFYVGGRRGPVSSTDMFKGFVKHLPIAIIVGFATWIMNYELRGLPPLGRLTVCAAVGLVVGAGATYLLPSSHKVSSYLLSSAKQMRNSKRVTDGSPAETSLSNAHS